MNFEIQKLGRDSVPTNMPFSQFCSSSKLTQALSSVSKCKEPAVFVYSPWPQSGQGSIYWRSAWLPKGCESCLLSKITLKEHLSGRHKVQKTTSGPMRCSVAERIKVLAMQACLWSEFCHESLVKVGGKKKND